MPNNNVLTIKQLDSLAKDNLIAKDWKRTSDLVEQESVQYFFNQSHDYSLDEDAKNTIIKRAAKNADALAQDDMELGDKLIELIGKCDDHAKAMDSLLDNISRETLQNWLLNDRIGDVAQQKFWNFLKISDSQVSTPYRQQKMMTMLIDSESIGQAINRWFGMTRGQDRVKQDALDKILSNHKLLQNMASTMNGQAMLLDLIKTSQRFDKFRDQNSLILLPAIAAYVDKGGKAHNIIPDILNRIAEGDLNLVSHNETDDMDFEMVEIGYSSATLPEPLENLAAIVARCDEGSIFKRLMDKEVIEQEHLIRFMEQLIYNLSTEVSGEKLIQKPASLRLQNLINTVMQYEQQSNDNQTLQNIISHNPENIPKLCQNLTNAITDETSRHNNIQQILNVARNVYETHVKPLWQWDIGGTANIQIFNYYYTWKYLVQSYQFETPSLDNSGKKLLRAAQEGDLQTVKDVLNQIDDVAEYTDIIGRNALQLAASEGRTYVLDEIKNYVGDDKFNQLLQKTDSIDQNVLHKASLYNRINVVDYLRQNCDNVSWRRLVTGQDHLHQTPVYTALQYQYRDGLAHYHKILDNDLFFEAVRDESERNMADTTRSFNDENRSINDENKLIRSFSNRAEITEPATDFDEKTLLEALRWSAVNGNQEVINYIDKAKLSELVLKQDSHGDNILHKAFRHSQTGYIEKIKKSVDGDSLDLAMNQKNQAEATPYSVALQHKNIKLFEQYAVTQQYYYNSRSLKERGISKTDFILDGYENEIGIDRLNENNFHYYAMAGRYEVLANLKASHEQSAIDRHFSDRLFHMLQREIRDRKDKTDRNPIYYARLYNRYEFLDALKDYLTPKQITVLGIGGPSATESDQKQNVEQPQEQFSEEQGQQSNTAYKLNENETAQKQTMAEPQVTSTANIHSAQKHKGHADKPIAQNYLSRSRQPANDSAQYFMKQQKLPDAEQGQSYGSAIFELVADIEGQKRQYREIISTRDNETYHHDFQALANDRLSGWHIYKETYLQQNKSSSKQLDDSTINAYLTKREIGKSHKEACQNLDIDKKRQTGLDKAYLSYSKHFQKIGKKNSTTIPPSQDFKLAAEMVENFRMANGDENVHVYEGDIADPSLLKAMAIYMTMQDYQWTDHTGLALKQYAQDRENKIKQHPEKYNDLRYLARYYQQQPSVDQSAAVLRPDDTPKNN